MFYSFKQDSNEVTQCTEATIIQYLPTYQKRFNKYSCLLRAFRIGKAPAFPKLCVRCTNTISSAGGCKVIRATCFFLSQTAT